MLALIVDDSRPIRRIEGEILRDLGYETREASNGVQALEILSNEATPDLLLVDWNMPEMDGLELIRAIRANPTYSEIAIIMITTESDSDQMLRALSAGADEYLMKPFARDCLINKLHLVGMPMCNATSTVES